MRKSNHDHFQFRHRYAERSNETKNQHREIMTVVELAAYLKVSRHTVYSWISASKLPFAYIKLPRSVRFDRRVVDDWLKSLEVPPVSSFN